MFTKESPQNIQILNLLIPTNFFHRVYGLTNCKPCWLFTPLEFGNNSASTLIPQILIKCELKRWRTNSYSTDGLWWSSPRNTIIRGKNNLAITCSTSKHSVRIRGYQRLKILNFVDALFTFVSVKQNRDLGYTLMFWLPSFQPFQFAGVCPFSATAPSGFGFMQDSAFNLHPSTWIFTSKEQFELNLDGKLLKGELKWPFKFPYDGSNNFMSNWWICWNCGAGCWAIREKPLLFVLFVSAA